MSELPYAALRRQAAQFRAQHGEAAMGTAVAPAERSRMARTKLTNRGHTTSNRSNPASLKSYAINQTAELPANRGRAGKDQPGRGPIKWTSVARPKPQSGDGPGLLSKSMTSVRGKGHSSTMQPGHSGTTTSKIRRGGSTTTLPQTTMLPAGMPNRGHGGGGVVVRMPPLPHRGADPGTSQHRQETKQDYRGVPPLHSGPSDGATPSGLFASHQPPPTRGSSTAGSSLSPLNRYSARSMPAWSSPTGQHADATGGGIAVGRGGRATLDLRSPVGNSGSFGNTGGALSPIRHAPGAAIAANTGDHTQYGSGVGSSSSGASGLLAGRSVNTPIMRQGQFGQQTSPQPRAGVMIRPGHEPVTRYSSAHATRDGAHGTTTTSMSARQSPTQQMEHAGDGASGVTASGRRNESPEDLTGQAQDRRRASLDAGVLGRADRGWRRHNTSEDAIDAGSRTTDPPQLTPGYAHTTSAAARQRGGGGGGVGVNYDDDTTPMTTMERPSDLFRTRPVIPGSASGGVQGVGVDAAEAASMSRRASRASAQASRLSEQLRMTRESLRQQAEENALLRERYELARLRAEEQVTSQSHSVWNPSVGAEDSVASLDSRAIAGDVPSAATSELYEQARAQAASSKHSKGGAGSLARWRGRGEGLGQSQSLVLDGSDVGGHVLVGRVRSSSDAVGLRAAGSRAVGVSSSASLGLDSHQASAVLVTSGSQFKVGASSVSASKSASQLKGIPPPMKSDFVASRELEERLQRRVVQLRKHAKVTEKAEASERVRRAKAEAQLKTASNRLKALETANADLAKRAAALNHKLEAEKRSSAAVSGHRARLSRALRLLARQLRSAGVIRPQAMATARSVTAAPEGVPQHEAAMAQLAAGQDETVAEAAELVGSSAVKEAQMTPAQAFAQAGVEASREVMFLSAQTSEPALLYNTSSATDRERSRSGASSPVRPVSPQQSFDVRHMSGVGLSSPEAAEAVAGSLQSPVGAVMAPLDWPKEASQQLQRAHLAVSSSSSSSSSPSGGTGANQQRQRHARYTDDAAFRDALLVVAIENGVWRSQTDKAKAKAAKLESRVGAAERSAQSARAEADALRERTETADARHEALMEQRRELITALAGLAGGRASLLGVLGELGVVLGDGWTQLLADESIDGEGQGASASDVTSAVERLMDEQTVSRTQINDDEASFDVEGVARLDGTADAHSADADDKTEAEAWLAPGRVVAVRQQQGLTVVTNPSRAPVPSSGLDSIGSASMVSSVSQSRSRRRGRRDSATAILLGLPPSSPSHAESMQASNSLAITGARQASHFSDTPASNRPFGGPDVETSSSFSEHDSMDVSADLTTMGNDDGHDDERHDPRSTSAGSAAADQEPDDDMMLPSDELAELATGLDPALNDDLDDPSKRMIQPRPMGRPPSARNTIVSHSLVSRGRRPRHKSTDSGGNSIKPPPPPPPPPPPGASADLVSGSSQPSTSHKSLDSTDAPLSAAEVHRQRMNAARGGPAAPERRPPAAAPAAAPAPAFQHRSIVDSPTRSTVRDATLPKWFQTPQGAMGADASTSELAVVLAPTRRNRGSFTGSAGSTASALEASRLDVIGKSGGPLPKPEALQLMLCAGLLSPAVIEAAGRQWRERGTSRSGSRKSSRGGGGSGDGAGAGPGGSSDRRKIDGPSAGELASAQMQLFDAQLRNALPAQADLMAGIGAAAGAPSSQRRGAADSWGLLLRLRRAAGASVLLDATTESLSDALSALVAEACILTGAERGAVFMLDAQRDELWTCRPGLPLIAASVSHGKGSALQGSPTALPAPTEMRVPASQGVAGWVARCGAPVLVPDAHADTRFQPESDARLGIRTRNIVAVPILLPLACEADGHDLGVGPDGVVGVIQVANKRGRSVFSQQDLVVLGLLASQVASLLARRRQDELATGLASSTAKAAREAADQITTSSALLPLLLNAPQLEVSPSTVAAMAAASGVVGMPKAPVMRDIALVWLEQAEAMIASAVGSAGCRIIVANLTAGAGTGRIAGISCHDESAAGDETQLHSLLPAELQERGLWWSGRDLTAQSLGRRSMAGLRSSEVQARSKAMTSGLLAASISGGGARDHSSPLQASMEEAASAPRSPDKHTSATSQEPVMPQGLRLHGSALPSASLAARTIARGLRGAQILAPGSPGRAVWSNSQVDIEADERTLVIVPCWAPVPSSSLQPPAGMTATDILIAGVIEVGVPTPSTIVVASLEMLASRIAPVLAYLATESR